MHTAITFWKSACQYYGGTEGDIVRLDLHPSAKVPEIVNYICSPKSKYSTKLSDYVATRSSVASEVSVLALWRLGRWREKVVVENDRASQPKHSSSMAVLYRCGRSMRRCYQLSKYNLNDVPGQRAVDTECYPQICGVRDTVIFGQSCRNVKSV